MTETVSLEQASSCRPELLSRLNANTAEIIIVSNGAQIARLLPAHETSTNSLARRMPGGDLGLFVVPQEFFEPLPDDIIESVYGGGDRP